MVFEHDDQKAYEFIGWVASAGLPQLAVLRGCFFFCRSWVASAGLPQLAVLREVHSRGIPEHARPTEAEAGEDGGRQGRNKTTQTQTRKHQQT